MLISIGIFELFPDITVVGTGSDQIGEKVIFSGGASLGHGIDLQNETDVFLVR